MDEDIYAKADFLITDASCAEGAAKGAAAAGAEHLYVLGGKGPDGAHDLAELIEASGEGPVPFVATEPTEDDVVVAALDRARLDREQRRELHLIVRMVRAVNLRRAEDQLHKGQVKQRGDFFACPVVADVAHSADSFTSCPAGGMLWPSRRRTSAAHSTTFEPGP